MELRFDFPPEVVEAREKVYARVRGLLGKQTAEAFTQARQLHLDWLEKHPDDYVALDAGEQIVMLENALELLEREQATEPVAA